VDEIHLVAQIADGGRQALHHADLALEMERTQDERPGGHGEYERPRHEVAHEEAPGSISMVPPASRADVKLGRRCSAANAPNTPIDSMSNQRNEAKPHCGMPDFAISQRKITQNAITGSTMTRNRPVSRLNRRAGGSRR